MILISFILLSGCAEPLIQNKSAYRWNRLDDEELVFASKQCGEAYPKSPCIQNFIKTDERTYSVTCTGKKKGER